MSKDKGQMTDDRRQMTDDRGQMTEDRWQRTDVFEFGIGNAEWGFIRFGIADFAFE